AMTASAGSRGAGLLATTRLGQAGRDRGLYRYAAELWTAAAGQGHADAAARLVSLLHETGHEDTGRAAAWAAERAGLTDPGDTTRLLEAARAAGAGEAIRVLLARDPAGQAGLRSRWEAPGLLVP